MARQLKGKEQKETKEQKRARLQSLKESREIAEKYVLPGFGAFFVALFIFIFIWSRM